MADSKANRPWRILLLVVLFVSVTKSQTIYCNTTSPCVNDACCQWKDNQGICGYGSFCQTDCISNCNATAECGKDAKDPSASCPLNVCCSQWGFCGTGDLFCGNGCQGDNCGDPTVPSCSSNNVLNRVVGYYESWSSGRACDAWRPSDMAVFAEAVLKTLQQYGFDGVDLDWEYPAASDRAGKTADTVNYVYLVNQLRKTFDESGQTYGITFTIPTSYWYMQHFDIPAMLEGGADWANLMAYDLHGVWDGKDPNIGSVIASHTNLTEIKASLDLLWRAGVNPTQIVMGMGFYGRSFTLSDYSCTEPGCPFSGPGTAGSCSNSSGILSYKEITEIMDEEGSELIWNEEAAVNYLVWGGNQWISFDNAQTFQQKVDYANSVCLGGAMIWAVDQDTYDWKALSGLLGQAVDGNDLLNGGSLLESQKKSLVSELSAYTGADCYISDCVDINTGQCKSGYSVLDYVHSASGNGAALQNPDSKQCHSGSETDHNSQYRMICCPAHAMPEGCVWEGANEFGLCSGNSSTCGDNKYELVADTYNDRTGTIRCLINQRSLCCNTNSLLNECHWSGCADSCPTNWTTNEWGSIFGGNNLNPDEGEACPYLYSFCCPSTDTYKNCEWHYCDYCPSDKVLITRRMEIDFFLNEGYYSRCGDTSTGALYNSFCCDPPSASENRPVDPADLFEYPDEDHVMYSYEVEKTSNDDVVADNTSATNNENSDPFAFVMIDGDPEAYDESLVDQWSFLVDEEQLTKRSLKMHERRSIFEYRDDTFDNEVEVYHIQCSTTFINGTSGCMSIFQGGANNTIVKMPKDIGAGPFARVISLVPVGSTGKSGRSNILPRSSTNTYELTVDYDLAGASAERSGDVNFRVDYTNLLEYWKDITDTPSKRRKRWFGGFSAWLSKMTSITKKDQGYLPMEYDETIKLFHAQGYCPDLNITATVDLDANIHLALRAQYGYYFEGAILPTPSLIAAYGYFSVAPEASILFTLRGEAVWQSTTGTQSIISGITFPGLSIKGLISIGPELELTGKMDASLSISGELNAGVVASWPRAEVYFPQDDGGSDATIMPKDIVGDDPQTFSVDPIFDASLTAEGNMALTLTPQVKFGISVLGGSLMSGYVTAGVDNTVSLGINASASVSYDGTTSAGFCYWADYIYSFFVSADVSFLNDLAYWGSSYEAASPDDPIVLVENTCITYSSNDPLSKRSSVESLVANSTGSGCFGGLVECSTTVSAGNSSCTLTSGDEGSGTTTSKRAPQCYNLPALFYNCDLFGATAVTNRNQNTMQNFGSKSFIGICDNVRNYLQKNPGKIKGNGMELTYFSSNEQQKTGGNRHDACSAKYKECVQEKTALWPTEVQSMYNWQTTQTINGVRTIVPAPTDYALMQGYDDSLSCDEFPFNASEEGGTGAEVACVSAHQNDYQGTINSLISNIYDARTGTTMPWSGWTFAKPWTGQTRKYRINLTSGTHNGYDLSYAGEITYAPYDMAYILGGLNLWGNPELYLSPTTRNAVCLLGSWYNPLLGINEGRAYGCDVTFAAQTTLFKRAQDPDDPSTWVVEKVQVSAEDLKNPIPLFTEDGKGYLDNAARNLEGMMEKLNLEADQEKEPMITATPHASHLRSDKESHHYRH
ncbi:bacteriodes thetaiotaomicron symbiotic chitinase, putative [Talaromyces marneffei ATCC 18224]|uniref:chitinase n=1 Tax=Talaromyces marneffei (strain ATCC 18224 / CBS 334.59 / QM 7333) TaxID=441960 RepID=B6QVU1_TALMQ|nr:bacteriodes thetaiotaomicron symbiotic chitinase, putative [Talaromyces marneffei ATCC 18224]